MSRKPKNSLKVKRYAANGEIKVESFSGQEAKAVNALILAKERGVTALEVATWAYRLSAYIHTLRHRHGYSIERRDEPHDGGWHGRYILHERLEIVLD